MRNLFIIFFFVSGLSAKEKINSVGSDTLNNVMILWAEAFEIKSPGSKIVIESKGSSTAIPALINGAADISPMSRLPNIRELTSYKEKFNTEPSIFTVAFDAMAVFVHKDNPLSKRGLTLAEADAIFSTTRKHGFPKDITHWNQLGLNGDFHNRRIVKYSKNSASAMYGFFQKIVLARGSFKKDVKQQPSGGVINCMANNIYGIGYSGLGFKNSGVKVVPIIIDGDKIEASHENCTNGKYPLARKLYLVTHQNPKKIVKEFIKFALSKAGQQIVVKDGYYPLREKEIAEELKKLE